MGCVTFKNSRTFYKDPQSTSNMSKDKIYWHPEITRTVITLKKSRFFKKLGSFQRNLSVIVECPSEAEVSFY